MDHGKMVATGKHQELIQACPEYQKSVSYTHLLGIKKRILDIRENVIGAIKTTDKDIEKTALLAKVFREARQTAANAFRT